MQNIKELILKSLNHNLYNKSCYAYLQTHLQLKYFLCAIVTKCEIFLLKNQKGLVIF